LAWPSRDSRRDGPDENRPLAAEAFVISTSPYWRIIDSPLADLRDRRLPQYTTAS
jgi:hypothetical protein